MICRKSYGNFTVARTTFNNAHISLIDVVVEEEEKECEIEM
jgi:hypothetical protein